MQVEIKFSVRDLVGDMRNGLYDAPDGASVETLLDIAQKEAGRTLDENVKKSFVFLVNSSSASWETALHDGEREAFDALTPKEKSVFEAAVLWRATLFYRLSRLRALEEFRPFIRGDAGWKGLLNGKFRRLRELYG